MLFVLKILEHAKIEKVAAYTSWRVRLMHGGFRMVLNDLIVLRGRE